MERDYLVLVDCMEDKCPLPFVKTRNALLKAERGGLIKVVGRDEKSYHEILMALEIWDTEVLQKINDKGQWEITFKVL
jgi:TusA-related sulfurtransferase